MAIDGEQVTGVEPTYVEGFAESLGAEVEWHVMGEEGAVDALERGEVDVLVGGLTADNPHEPRRRPPNLRKDRGRCVPIERPT